MNFTLRTAALAAAIACCNGAADASTLIGTEYAGVTPLYTLSQTTGALTAGPATGIADIGDLASTGADNTVWGVGITANTLYRFNVSTGATISTVPISGTLSATGAPEKIVSIAFDAKAGQILGTSDPSLGGGNDLFRINPATGAATLIGNFQVPSMYALAYDNVAGVLYGASGAFGASPSMLWRISTVNAVASFIGNLGALSNFDIAFRPEDNKLFMASSTSNALYTVDPLTAATTLVGPYGSVTNIAGLAFAVPEPQTWALMFAGLAAVATRLRRRH